MLNFILMFLSANLAGIIIGLGSGIIIGYVIKHLQYFWFWEGDDLVREIKEWWKNKK